MQVRTCHFFISLFAQKGPLSCCNKVPGMNKDSVALYVNKILG